MHERGVARDLVRTAGVVAVDQGARRVRALRIELGPASHLQAESLTAQVTFHARGTIVEGAEVIIERRVLSDDALPKRDDDRVLLRSVDVEV